MIADFFEYFSLKPILRAFLAFIISGASFPVVGVFIVTMDLIPLRFALMHGALLGGVIGIILNFNNIIFPLLTCLVIILTLGPLSERFKVGLSNISAFFMMFTVAIAFILIDKKNISYQDAFNVFWGNIFALSNFDILSLLIMTIIIIIFLITSFNKITAILFNRDVAFTIGINSKFFYYLVLTITGCVVAVSIKIIGALLVDCLLVLPAIAALYFARSIKGLFIKAVLIGLISSILGFIISIFFKLQPSPAVTVVSTTMILLFYFLYNVKILWRKQNV